MKPVLRPSISRTTKRNRVLIRSIHLHIFHFNIHRKDPTLGWMRGYDNIWRREGYNDAEDSF